MDTLVNVKDMIEPEYKEFEILLEEGEIDVSHDAISLAYVLPSPNGYEVYTNSGYKVGTYDDADLARRKAFSMRMYTKKLMDRDKGTYNPETGKSPKGREKAKNLEKQDYRVQEKLNVKPVQPVNKAIKDRSVRKGNKEISENPEDAKTGKVNTQPQDKQAILDRLRQESEKQAPDEIDNEPLKDKDNKILPQFVLARNGEWDFARDLKLLFKVDGEFQKKLVENFNKGTRGQRIPVVDHHEGNNKAYGWISKMWIEGDKTLIKIRWNPRGKKALSDEEYGYCSPNFIFDYYDPETKQSYGPTVTELTLTNAPRIKRTSAMLVGFSECAVAENSNYGIQLEELSNTPSGEGLKNMLGLVNNHQLPKQEREQILSKLITLAKPLGAEIIAQVNLNEVKDLNINNNLINKKDGDGVDGKETERRQERRVQEIVDENITIDSTEVNPESNTTEIVEIEEVKSEENVTAQEAPVNTSDDGKAIILLNEIVSLLKRKEDVSMDTPTQVTNTTTAQVPDLPTAEVKLSEKNVTNVMNFQSPSPEAIMLAEMKEAMSSMKDTMSVMLSELNSQKQANEQMSTQLAEEKKMRYQMQLSERLEKLADAGKILPMDIPMHLSKLERAHKADQVLASQGIKLSEGDASISLEEDYFNMLSQNKAKVTYGEVGKAVNTNDGVPGVSLSEQISSEAKLVAKRDNIKLSEAFIKVTKEKVGDSFNDLSSGSVPWGFVTPVKGGRQ